LNVSFGSVVQIFYIFCYKLAISDYTTVVFLYISLAVFDNKRANILFGPLAPRKQ